MTTEYTNHFALAKPDFRMGPWHDLMNGNTDAMDALIYSALSSVDTLPWANNTAYSVGTPVIDTDNAQTYMCNVSHTSRATGTFEDDRTAHPTYWIGLLSGFAPRGEWTNATNYYPYDLAYDSLLGIFAQCKTKHVSNTSGRITDDSVYWYWIVNFSESDLSSALAVTYDPTASGLGVFNVQTAIDKLETQIVALNNVNVTQGTQITNLQAKDTTHDSQISAIQSVNGSQGTDIANLQAAVTVLQGQMANAAVFATGTKMLFYQASPPTGWTIVGGLADRGIRVVSDGSGGSNGGTIAFSTVFARTATDGFTLAGAHMPSHGHGYLDTTTVNNGAPIQVPALGADAYNYAQQYSESGVGRTTDPMGGNTAHAHGIDLRLAYVNVCVGSKN